MNNESQKALLERIEASVEVLNKFGAGDSWRAELLKPSLEGTWSIKRGTFGMADQLADVFAQVNFGENDRQDAEGVAKAMVEARNTSRHLLTEAAAEITRLEAENAALRAELEARVTPRPIEQAPKDERVLVHFDATKDGFCYWEQAVFVDGKWVLDSGLDPFDVATHWLPLPPDPTEVTEVTE